MKLLFTSGEKKCQEVLRSDRVSIRKLSEVIGNLTASLQTVHQVPLHYDYDQESSFERPELRYKSSSISRSQTRLILEEQPSEGVQWQKHSIEPRVRCHTNRCHQSRLGTSLSEHEIKGSMIFEREPVSY
jgi:hypothetical protein